MKSKRLGPPVGGKIAHLSGAGDYINKLDRDVDDVGVRIGNRWQSTRCLGESCSLKVDVEICGIRV
jgi:hypothetical protein